MPWFVCVLAVLTVALAPRPAAAGDRDDDEPALVSAEVRAGYGVSVGGGAGRASLRGSPLILAARVAVAIRDQPRMSGYGGLVIETLDRTGVGGEGGITLEPSIRTRVRAGVIAMIAPYKIYGGAVGAGRCFVPGSARICLDLDADVFVGGSDLPMSGAALQVVFGLGNGFDAN